MNAPGRRRTKLARRALAWYGQRSAGAYQKRRTSAIREGREMANPIGKTKKLLYSWPETEELCNASRRHLKRMIAAGAMPAPITVGGLVRFRAAEIESWVAGGC